MFLSYLVVLWDQVVQMGQAAPLSQGWAVPVGHELQEYQVYQGHLVSDRRERCYPFKTFLGDINDLK